MYASLISAIVLVLAIVALFIHSRLFGKCFFYPIQMKKQINTNRVVSNIIKAIIRLAFIALIISLIVWYYQWGMDRADQVVFIL